MTGEKVKVGAWVWTRWPTFDMPTEEWLKQYAAARGQAVLEQYHAHREHVVKREQEEPLSWGWEQPPVDIVRDLLAGTYVPGTFGLSVAPKGWEQKGTANDLVMLGGNGSGKSDLQAKFGMTELCMKTNAEWRAFSQNEMTSIRYVQRPAFKYLPSAFRTVKSRGHTLKISYKEATGFSEGCFILPNHSAALFPTYKGWEQDRNSVEGGEADIATWDEEAPAELLRTLRFRVHKKGGYVLGGFTPIGGYTATVAEYIEGSVILEVIPARMVVWDWSRTRWDEKRKKPVYWSWGEWLLPEKQELVKGCPKGHVPFVVQSGQGGGRRFAVALPTMFNPYTNVSAIIESTEAGKRQRRVEGEKLAFALERLWGWPTKMAHKAFPNFGEVHVVPPEKVPPLSKLTVWWWADPHGDRNWFMIWTGVDEKGVKWTFKEWPGEEVGEWAVPGDKPDGKAGPAQTAGGGKAFDDYKRLILEQEGWKPGGDGVWSMGDKAFAVFDRQIDPRPAGTSVPSDSDCRTYLDHLNEPLVSVGGRVLLPTLDVRAGVDCAIEEGKQWVNQWVNDGWDPHAAITPMNCPKWYISSACANTIWALKTYTGADGMKGACKDPIDCLKGLSKSGIRHMPRGLLGSAGQTGGY